MCEWEGGGEWSQRGRRGKGEWGGPWARTTTTENSINNFEVRDRRGVKGQNEHGGPSPPPRPPHTCHWPSPCSSPIVPLLRIARSLGTTGVLAAMTLARSMLSAATLHRCMAAITPAGAESALGFPGSSRSRCRGLGLGSVSGCWGRLCTRKAEGRREKRG